MPWCQPSELRAAAVRGTRPARARQSRRQWLFGDDAPGDAVTKAAGRRVDALEMTAAQPPLPVLVDCSEPADPRDRLGLADIWVLRIFRDVSECTCTAHVRERPVAV